MLIDFQNKTLRIVKYLQSRRALLGMHDVCKGPKCDTHRITTHLDGSRMVSMQFASFCIHILWGVRNKLSAFW